MNTYINISVNYATIFQIFICFIIIKFTVIIKSKKLKHIITLLGMEKAVLDYFKLRKL